MKKIGQFLSCIVPFLCAILIQLTVSILATVIYGAVQGATLAAQGVTDTTEIASVVAKSITPEVLLIISVLAAVINIPVFVLWYKKLIKEEKINKVKDVFSLKGILIIVALGIGIQLGISGILYIVSSINPSWFNSYSDVMNILGEGTTMISFLYIGFIAPISEEFLFRGVILKKFSRIMPFMAANIMQAILFGIYHMNLIQGIYGFIIGLFLGFIYKKTRSILGAIFLHMAINLSGILLGGVLSNSIFDTPITLVVMIILAVILIIVSMKLIYKTYISEDEILLGVENEGSLAL